MSKTAWIAIVSISIVIGTIIAFVSNRGDSGNGFVLQTITIEGFQREVFASKVPLDLMAPIIVTVPTESKPGLIMPFAFVNKGNCECFSANDASGSVPCATGDFAIPGQKLLVACQAPGFRLERDIDLTVPETPATEAPATEEVP